MPAHFINMAGGVDATKKINHHQPPTQHKGGQTVDPPSLHLLILVTPTQKPTLVRLRSLVERRKNEKTTTESTKNLNVRDDLGKASFTGKLI